MFSEVSVCPMGEGVYTPEADTFPWANTPLGRHPMGRHPPPATRQTSPPPRWRTVHILLEYILIYCHKTYFKGRKGATFVRNFTNTLNLSLKIQLSTLDSLDIFFQTLHCSVGTNLCCRVSRDLVFLHSVT